MRKILITGFGGFIGFSIVQRLKNKFQITALDNFSDFSNYPIKQARAGQLGIPDFDSFKSETVFQLDSTVFHYADLSNSQQLEKIFSATSFDLIIHLAALTGVRQSLLNPSAYLDSNIKGFVNLLECARKFEIRKIIYASSSSVYGLNDETPYTEDQRTDSPISVYAASKKANEILANVYSHLYGMSLTGLRFFTVYGPWTRPDMASYIFMKAIREKKSIDLFNEGKMVRDFTYVGDVVEAISLLVDKMLKEELSSNRIFNIGNHQPVFTIDFLRSIERAMGEKAIVNFKPVQPGDMLSTNASCQHLYNYIGFEPQTSIEDGVNELVEWFNEFTGK